MSEEAIQDTGSQEVAADAAAPVHFLDGVDEQYRTNPTLQNFNDVNGLAKSYVHLRSKMGADTLVKPQQSWTDDQYNEFYTELGRPQTFEEYDIQGATGDGLDQYKQAAHAAGLSNRQAQAMANYLQTLTEDMSVQSEQALESTNNETRAALEREYGQALKQKMQMADAVSSRYLSPEVFDSIELADGRSLGDHPDIIRMFVNIAQDIGEDSLIGEAQELVMTPQEAEQTARRLMSEGPYKDKFHPEHQHYVDEVYRHFQMAEGGQA